MSWHSHKEFAQDWIESWNAHDLERIMSHYADDIVLTSPRVKQILGRDDGTVSGKANLREYFTTGLSRLPNLRFDLVRYYSGVGSLVLEFNTIDGRHVAEFMSFNKDGLVNRVYANNEVK